MDQGIDKTNVIIKEVFGDKLNLDDNVPNPAYYVNGNDKTTWRQYILYNLRHTFGMMENEWSKYLPTVARLAYSDAVRFDVADDNGAEVRTLQRIVNELKQQPEQFQKLRTELNQAGADPSDVFNGLREMFADKFRQADEKDAAEANSVEDNGSEYTVVEVEDFETAKYYGDRSCSESKLCYTQSESTWKSYAANGINAVYVCLRDGWEDIPEVPTEGNPYDLYGTSMIFVFVSPKGEITCSNSRWNHKGVGLYATGNCDHAFTKATLSKTIGMPFDSVFKPKEVDIAQMIEKGGGNLRDIAVGDFAIPDGIRKIGNHAFQGCTGLTSVTIPNSVKEIGNDAFYYCTGLTSVTIPNSVKEIGNAAFRGCTGLTSVTIPNSVTTIGEFAFYRCENMASITIPKSVTSIGNEAFTFCPGLTSIMIETGNPKYDSRDNCNAIIETASKTLIAGCKTTTIPNSVTSIGGHAFSGCSGLTSINIPNSVTKISSYAFSWCIGLTSVTIPDSVTTIGDEAFTYCRGLTSITIPNSVTKIGNCAFLSCVALTSITVETGNPNYDSRDDCNAIIETATNTLIAGCKNTTIPNTATTIGDNAFKLCTNLTSITIPDSVTTIGFNTFAYCFALTSVTIPDSVTDIGEGAFECCSGLTSIEISNSVTSISTSTFSYCRDMKNVSIPDSVISIGDNAFFGCDGLTRVTIPNSVTEIGSYAFYLCSGLTSITIPGSVTSIGDNAFSDCTGLTSVTIPKSVTSIGEGAFCGCTALTSVTIPDSVTSIAKFAFFRCPNLTVYAGDEEHAEMVRWSGFEGAIVIGGVENDIQV